MQLSTKTFDERYITGILRGSPRTEVLKVQLNSGKPYLREKCLYRTDKGVCKLSIAYEYLKPTTIPTDSYELPVAVCFDRSYIRVVIRVTPTSQGYKCSTRINM